MRFISKYANYAFCVRPQVVEAYATGATKIIQDQIVARFSINEPTPDERALARHVFHFNGFYQEEDLVSIREPDYRISAFDSRKAQAEQGWTDAEREAVEQVLVRECQLVPEDIYRIEDAPLAPPWPAYDDYAGPPTKLVQKILDDGFDLAQVLAYEQENQARAPIVAAMERALEAEPDTTPVQEEELVG